MPSSTPPAERSSEAAEERGSEPLGALGSEAAETLLFTRGAMGVAFQVTLHDLRHRPLWLKLVEKILWLGSPYL